MTERITWKNGEWAELGCWIDGHWGQYAPDRLIRIALNEGWRAQGPEDELLADIACTRLDEIGSRADTTAALCNQWIARFGRFEHAIDAEGEVLSFIPELSDECEQWLNDQCPEGYNFGWHDGEFFLQSTEWWEENDG